MKKYRYSFLLCAILSQDSFAQLNIESGWNLVGVGSSIGVDAFDEVSTIWKYRDKEWLVYSPNSEISKLIESSSYSTFDSIDAGEGFWVLSKKPLTIDILSNNIDSIEYNINGWSILSPISNLSTLSFKESAILWKYVDKEWSNNFDTIYPYEGFWIYSYENLKVDYSKYSLFLNSSLEPIKNIEYQDLSSNTFGFINNSVEDKSNLILDTKYEIESSNNNIFYLNSTDFNYDLDSVNSSELSIQSYFQPDFYEDIFDIQTILLDAKPANPVLMDSSGDFLISIEDLGLDKSLTISMTLSESVDDDSIKTLFGDDFISKVEFNIKGVDKSELNLSDFDNKVLLNLFYKPDNKIDENIVIYAQKDDMSWELISSTSYLESFGFYSSDTPYSGFTNFIFAKKSDFGFKKDFLCKDSLDRVLNSCIAISPTKNMAISDYNGVISFSDFDKPQELAIYKKGYLPKKIDLSTSSVTLKEFDRELNSNIEFGFDSFFIGDNNNKFNIDSIDEFDSNIELLSNIDSPIYSKALAYNNQTLIAATNGVIYNIDGTIYSEELKGSAIYSSFFESNNKLILASLDSKVSLIESLSNFKSNNEYSSDDIPSFIDSGEILDNRLFIPIYNHNEVGFAYFDLEYLEYDMLVPEYIKNYQNPSKVSIIDNRLAFVSNSSFILLNSDTTENSSIKLDNISRVVASPILLDSSYFIIDIYGNILSISNSSEIDRVSIDIEGKILDSQLYKDGILIASTTGEFYSIDKDLEVSKIFTLDTQISSKPIIYNNNIYLVGKYGDFFINDKKVGNFNSKVISTSLVDNKIIFGTEKGEVWSIYVK